MLTMVYSVSLLLLVGMYGDTNCYLGLVFGGALFAFCVSRLPMFDVNGFYVKSGGVGEYFYSSICK